MRIISKLHHNLGHAHTIGTVGNNWTTPSAGSRACEGSWKIVRQTMKTENQLPQKTEGHHCQGAGELLPEPVLARDGEAMRSLARGVFEISFEIFNIRVCQQKTNKRAYPTHTHRHARAHMSARTRAHLFVLLCAKSAPTDHIDFNRLFDRFVFG